MIPWSGPLKVVPHPKDAQPGTFLVIGQTDKLAVAPLLASTAKSNEGPIGDYPAGTVLLRRTEQPLAKSGGYDVALYFEYKADGWDSRLSPRVDFVSQLNLAGLDFGQLGG
jgi:hypothetical protein